MRERIPCPEPGVYRGIPAEEYHAWDAVSNSALGLMAGDGTPAHARYLLDNPKPACEGMTRGDALHLALLEPTELHSRYAVATPCTAPVASGERQGLPCGNTGKALVGGEWRCGTHARGRQSEESRLVLPEQLYSDVVGMHRSVWSLPEAVGLLRGTQEREVSLVFDWTLSDRREVRCKCRVDVPLWDVVFADFKSTTRASDAAFAKSIAEYGYYRQAAFYREAARALGLAVPEFLFFPVENTPPYLARVVEVDPRDVELGRLEAERLLGVWHTCTTTDTWPGYPAGARTISLPEWKRAALQREIAA